jgi:outer membrane protein TolC
MQTDVLRSQAEISMLLQRLTMLEQQRATAQARLNTLLALDRDAAIHVYTNATEKVNRCSNRSDWSCW